MSVQEDKRAVRGPACPCAFSQRAPRSEEAGLPLLIRPSIPFLNLLGDSLMATFDHQKLNALLSDAVNLGRLVWPSGPTHRVCVGKGLWPRPHVARLAVTAAPGTPPLGSTALPSAPSAGYGARGSGEFRRKSIACSGRPCANKGAGGSCVWEQLRGEFNCQDVREKNMTLWGTFQNRIVHILKGST